MIYTFLLMASEQNESGQNIGDIRSIWGENLRPSRQEFKELRAELNDLRETNNALRQHNQNLLGELDMLWRELGILRNIVSPPQFHPPLDGDFRPIHANFPPDWENGQGSNHGIPPMEGYIPTSQP